jgi:hypothetical protein
MKLALASLLILVAALGAAACGGESKEQQATTTVCDARADIATQVGHVKGLTLSTAATGQVRSSLSAIQADLKSIANAQGDLADQRRAQVQSAGDAFSSTVKDVAASIGTSLSLGGARSAVAAAGQQLETAYKQTFAKIDCP